MPANYTAGIAAINRAVPVTINPMPGQTTVSASANTDLFMFGSVDANNFKLINGLAAGDMLDVSDPDGTNGDFRLAQVASAAVVDSKGEWFFNAATDILTYWNGTSNTAGTVQLTGVNTLSVDVNAVFTIVN
ncbi:MAG: hypothetical protein ACREX0_18170 [Noviherbaspirillum sp.]